MKSDDNESEGCCFLPWCVEGCDAWGQTPRPVDQYFAMSSATLEQSELQCAGPPQALCEKLLAHSSELTVLPAVATEALELAKDPECSISRFSNLVERARTHFVKADEVMARNSRRAVRAPRIMSKYYRAILELLVARGFAVPRDPGIGPAAVVADPDGSARVDLRDRPGLHHLLSRSSGVCQRAHAQRVEPRE